MENLCGFKKLWSLRRVSEIEREEDLVLRLGLGKCTIDDQKEERPTGGVTATSTDGTSTDDTTDDTSTDVAPASPRTDPLPSPRLQVSLSNFQVSILPSQFCRSRFTYLC